MAVPAKLKSELEAATRKRRPDRREFEALPGFIEPMLLLKTEQLPEGEPWLYELNLDGYRAIGAKSGGRIHLWSRSENDFGRRYWLWTVEDIDESAAWVKRRPNPMPGPNEIEFRPIYEAEDVK